CAILAKLNLARLRREQAANDSQKRGLARAVGAGHHQRLAVTERKRQASENRFATPFARQIVGFQPHFIPSKPRWMIARPLEPDPRKMHGKASQHFAARGRIHDILSGIVLENSLYEGYHASGRRGNHFWPISTCCP